MQPFQSAGKGAKEVAMGTTGAGRGGGAAHSHRAGGLRFWLGGMRAGCGAGPGSKVPERLAGQVRAPAPSWEPAQPRAVFHQNRKNHRGKMRM